MTALGSSSSSRVEEVRVGQTWRMLMATGQEQIMRIDRIETEPKTGRKRVVGTCPKTGRMRTADVASLERRLRGARLLSHPDGTPATLYVKPVRLVVDEDKPRPVKTRIYKPKGVLQRPITLFETECTQLRARGVSLREISRRLKRAYGSVETALENVEEIRAAMRMREDTGT
jgi:hypothetical protein